MEKSIFEQMGGTYREDNGYLIPNLSFPAQINHKIGKYGLLHLNYIKVHCKGRYTTILTEGILNSYLHQVDTRAIKMLEDLVTLLADQRGIDERLKEQNELLWVAEMNNVKASAEEIVLKEVIYK